MAAVDRSAARRRLRACVEAWPECSTGEYDPRCCRFPKSCSCTVYDEHVTEADLESRADPPAATALVSAARKALAALVDEIDHYATVDEAPEATLAATHDLRRALEAHDAED